jgi:hypothetical protein
VKSRSGLTSRPAPGYITYDNRNADAATELKKVIDYVAYLKSLARFQ